MVNVVRLVDVYGKVVGKYTVRPTDPSWGWNFRISPGFFWGVDFAGKGSTGGDKSFEAN